MPAEVSSATLMLALAAFAAALLFLPFVLLVAAPFVAARLLLRPKTPAHRRGGYYAMD